MNKIILSTAMIAACGLFGVAANAQGTTEVSATVAATRQPAASTDVALGTRQVPAPDSRNCIRSTGSHIQRRDQVCLPVSGNSYSREDIERTGNPDMGEALQQLDPSVTGHGH